MTTILKVVEEGYGSTLILLQYPRRGRALFKTNLKLVRHAYWKCQHNHKKFLSPFLAVSTELHPQSLFFLRKGFTM